ncbi:hypothetical protein CDAR_543581 [Caerostris darwini]|uniref:Uncharacterized protein n=1 Tax=Caerostris darwini TaxID=1538125 RepID=A0AAV4V2J4_9ARAC|nr:hypothetical protein CDAR_543581 [Caerostris darwini]
MSIGYCPLGRGVVPTFWQCSADGTGRFGLRIRHYRNAASSNEGEVGRNAVVSDTPTPEKASLSRKQLSQKHRKAQDQKIISDESEGGCVCDITVSNSATTTLRFATGTDL